jgi:hypothetical protein
LPALAALAGDPVDGVTPESSAAEFCGGGDASVVTSGGTASVGDETTAVAGGADGLVIIEAGSWAGGIVAPVTSLTLLLGAAITGAPGAPNGGVTPLNDGGAATLSGGDGVTALEDVAGGDEINAGETFVALAGVSVGALCCDAVSVPADVIFADAEPAPLTTAGFDSTSALSVAPGVIDGAVGVAAPTLDELAGVDIVVAGVAAVTAAAVTVNGGVTGMDAAAEVGAAGAVTGATTGKAAVAGDCARASCVSAAAASTAATASVSALRGKVTRFFSTKKA